MRPVDLAYLKAQARAGASSHGHVLGRFTQTVDAAAKEGRYDVHKARCGKRRCFAIALVTGAINSTPDSAFGTCLDYSCPLPNPLPMRRRRRTRITKE